MFRVYKKPAFVNLMNISFDMTLLSLPFFSSKRRGKEGYFNRVFLSLEYNTRLEQT